MARCGWQREGERENLRVRVTHLSGSCHQTSVCSPLLLLGRVPSLLPSFMLGFISPTKRTAFWVCQSVLSEGDWGEKSGRTHLPQFIVNCGQKKNQATSVSKLQTPSYWRRREQILKQLRCEMEGALMG